MLTGFKEPLLRKLIIEGITRHELSINTFIKSNKKNLDEQLFNLDEVVNWIKLHIY